jgi:hypothetical protein
MATNPDAAEVPYVFPSLNTYDLKKEILVLKSKVVQRSRQVVTA